jgi:hypothetical protein
MPKSIRSTLFIGFPALALLAGCASNAADQTAVTAGANLVACVLGQVASQSPAVKACVAQNTDKAKNLNGLGAAICAAPAFASAGSTCGPQVAAAVAAGVLALPSPAPSASATPAA